jgi:5-methylthioadenosine/S-adenosylhomocysteine deaminase
MLKKTTKTIYNAVIITMDNNFTVIKNGYITIKDNIITDIGEGQPNLSNNLYDVNGMIIIPGFVNTHTHLPMTMYRGIADDLPLKEWLENHIWPAEAENTFEDNVRKATKIGLEEMIKTGTTTFCDMYFFADAVAEETEKAGLRAVMNEAALDFPTNSYKNNNELFKKIINFIEKWENNNLINPAAIFHSTYSCNKPTLTKIKNTATKYNLQISTHISETKDEVKSVTDSKGVTPAQYLYNTELLTNKTVAAHCVWLTESEQELFAKTGANIAHCPSSNLKLGSGIAPIHKYLEHGINVALGTDGCASNNNLDMVEEIRLAALIHKGNNLNPTLITARQALQMATINGAKALGLDKITGSIEKGKRADLLLISTNNTFMQPIYDYYSAIVYSMNSSCIDTVIVDGKVLMKKHKLIKNY